MVGQRHRLCGLAPGLLGVCLLALLPEIAAAQAVVLRNETRAPLVVQVAGVVRGSLRRDRPHLLAPGASTPAITVTGNLILTVYDAKMPNRILGQGVIQTGMEDQLLALVADAGGNRVRLEQRRVPRR